MTLGSIARGRVVAPLRIFLYGVEGVGKTSFGAAAPSPVFLGPEDGAGHLDVARFPQPRDWSDIGEAIETLVHQPHDFETLVVDTADWLEPLCWAEVCRINKVPGIESMGYGKGYVGALELWRAFVGRLEVLRRARGMHIVLLGHALIKSFKNPEGSDYDRYTLKLHDKAGGFFKEWCDEVLFAQFETFVATDDKKRVRGVASGNRMIRTVRTAAYDAKSRSGLPASLPLSWDAFWTEAHKGVAERLDQINTDLAASMTELDALNPEVAAKARAYVESVPGDFNRLSSALNQIHLRIAEASPSDDATASNP